MSVEQFANATIRELTALTDGYVRRREALEDLFIIYSAMPAYQCHMGRKAPSYKKLTAHRNHSHLVADIPEEEQNRWRDILKNI